MESKRQPGQTILDLTCRVSSASTHGAYCAFEFVTLPGEGVPLHVHAHEDELYYILEGTYEIECNGSTFTADAGAMAMIPRNLPHTFRNTDQKTRSGVYCFHSGRLRRLRPRTERSLIGGCGG